MARPASAKPNRHNTPTELTFLPIDTIQVVDPGHPLYGLSLPLLGVTNKQHVGKACVVWLQPGIERIVPFAATSLAETPPERPVARLSLDAIRRLVGVLAFLRELHPEDADDIPCAGPDTPALERSPVSPTDLAAGAAPASGADSATRCADAGSTRLARRSPMRVT